MHDIDRTEYEFEPEMDEFEFDGLEYEGESEFYEEVEIPLDDAEEMELATELLGVTDEAELDQFLGKLIKKVGRAARKFVKPALGGALGGILKGVAKRALPALGGAAGTFFGGPIGGMIGGKLGSMAGRMFGLELEGLSPEDQEFEVARRFVRFATSAAKKAVVAPPTIHPYKVAKAAVTAAAKKHAPGLVGRAIPTFGTGGIPGRSGRWIRRGRKIILLGI